MRDVDGRPRVAQNSMAARVILGFLVTAGMYYVLIMPMFVEALEEGLGFSTKQAGLVGSFNVYGFACGGLFIAFIVRRIPWRATAQFLLVGLVCMDLLSILFHTPSALMGIRFVDGFMGGVLGGVALSIMGRTKAPDRTFGVVALLQAIAAGATIMILSPFVPRFGAKALFGALILFNVVTLSMLPLLPDYAASTTEGRVPGAPIENTNLKLFLAALFSLLFLQTAYMGLYSFVIDLGTHLGLSLTFASTTLGISSWCAALGPLLVIVLSTRYGVFKPILVCMLVGLVGMYALNYGEVKSIWMVAMVGTGAAWLFGIPHLLGICSRFDDAGHGAVWGGFASSTGQASGPLLASLIVGAGNYTTLITAAVVLLSCALILSAAPAWVLDRREAAGLPGRGGHRQYTDAP